MNASQSLIALTTALVNPIAGDVGALRGRRQLFLLRGLVLLLAALAVAPFFLAFQGAPTLPQTIIFGFCIAPLAAIMLVSRTGMIVRGHGIYVACLIGIAITAAIAGQASLSCSFAWLVVAQMESLLSRDRRLVWGTGLAVGLTFGGLVTAAGTQLMATSATGGDILTGIALVCSICDAIMLAEVGVDPKPAARIEQRRLTTVAAMVEDLVVAHDRDGTVTFVGQGSEVLLNLASDHIIGRGLFELIHVADRPIFLTAIADAAHGTGTILATVRMRTPVADGHGVALFRWIEMRARRIRSEGDTPTAPSVEVISTLRDVTEAKHRESDLDEARAAATKASRAQDQFIANMSHELRTPLNAIIGFSEMLGHADLRPRDVAKQVDYARIIHESGHHLLAVVNSILDMSKIESGTFTIVPEPFDVAPLLGSCCEIVSLKALEGRIEVIRSESPAIEAIFGDRRACKQILLNLLSNAIKFTPANGQVVLGARPEGNSLLLSVVDTGIGIGAADLARLGDPFFQAKAAHDRPYEGTGLGLSVVRGLVGLHGGTISIESELGHGTSVTVRLPLDCRAVYRRDHTTRIETIPRRRSPERLLSQSSVTKVKKSA